MLLMRMLFCSSVQHNQVHCLFNDLNLSFNALDYFFMNFHCCCAVHSSYFVCALFWVKNVKVELMRFCGLIDVLLKKNFKSISYAPIRYLVFFLLKTQAVFSVTTNVSKFRHFHFLFLQSKIFRKFLQKSKIFSSTTKSSLCPHASFIKTIKSSIHWMKMSEWSAWVYD